jgi:TRAP-type mannitol/chloroaromatic compound transport system permease small subunit
MLEQIITLFLIIFVAIPVYLFLTYTIFRDWSELNTKEKTVGMYIFIVITIIYLGFLYIGIFEVEY